MIRISLHILLLLSISLVWSCSSDSDAPNPPTPINSNIEIETMEVTDVTDRSARSGGLIGEDGGSLILEKGVCWAVSPDPTIEDDRTNEGQGASQFQSSLTNLIPETTYYYRSYAKNKDGVGYGNQLLFNTYPSNVLKFSLSGSVNVEVESSEFTYDPSGGNFWYPESSPTLSDLIVFQMHVPSLRTANYDLDSSAADIFIEEIGTPFWIGYASRKGEIKVQDLSNQTRIEFESILISVGLGVDSIELSNGLIIFAK